MLNTFPRRLNRGDTITADWLNQLLEAAQAGTPREGPGLTASRDSSGTTLSVRQQFPTQSRQVPGYSTTTMREFLSPFKIDNYTIGITEGRVGPEWVQAFTMPTAVGLDRLELYKIWFSLYGVLGHPDWCPERGEPLPRLLRKEEQFEICEPGTNPSYGSMHELIGVITGGAVHSLNVTNKRIVASRWMARGECADYAETWADMYLYGQVEGAVIPIWTGAPGSWNVELDAVRGEIYLPDFSSAYPAIAGAFQLEMSGYSSAYEEMNIYGQVPFKPLEVYGWHEGYEHGHVFGDGTFEGTFDAGNYYDWTYYTDQYGYTVGAPPNGAGTVSGYVHFLYPYMEFAGVHAGVLYGQVISPYGDLDVYLHGYLPDRYFSMSADVPSHPITLPDFSPAGTGYFNSDYLDGIIYPPEYLSLSFEYLYTRARGKVPLFTMFTLQSA